MRSESETKVTESMCGPAAVVKLKSGGERERRRLNDGQGEREREWKMIKGGGHWGGLLGEENCCTCTRWKSVLLLRWLCFISSPPTLFSLMYLLNPAHCTHSCRNLDNPPTRSAIHWNAKELCLRNKMFIYYNKTKLKIQKNRWEILAQGRVSHSRNEEFLKMPPKDCRRKVWVIEFEILGLLRNSQHDKRIELPFCPYFAFQSDMVLMTTTGSFYLITFFHFNLFNPLQIDALLINEKHRQNWKQKRGSELRAVDFWEILLLLMAPSEHSTRPDRLYREKKEESRYKSQ